MWNYAVADGAGAGGFAVCEGASIALVDTAASRADLDLISGVLAGDTELDRAAILQLVEEGYPKFTVLHADAARGTLRVNGALTVSVSSDVGTNRFSGGSPGLILQALMNAAHPVSIRLGAAESARVYLPLGRGMAQTSEVVWFGAPEKPQAVAELPLPGTMAPIPPPPAAPMESVTPVSPMSPAELAVAVAAAQPLVAAPASPAASAVTAAVPAVQAATPASPAVPAAEPTATPTEMAVDASSVPHPYDHLFEYTQMFGVEAAAVRHTGEVDPADLPAAESAPNEPDAPEPSPSVVLPGGDLVSLDTPVILGRRPAADDGEARAVAVADPEQTMSRSHARVETDEAGAVWVTDLGSRNGSRVERADGTKERLPAHTPVALQPGDSFWLGEHTRVTLAEPVQM